MFLLEPGVGDQITSAELEVDGWRCDGETPGPRSFEGETGD